MENKYDIFISYSRKDYDEVKTIVEEIETKGINVWFDLKSVESGDEFVNKIAAAIDSSRLVIFIYTNNSANGYWTQKEVLYAKNQGKRVVPVLLNGMMPSKGWFNFLYGNVDCVDFSDKTQEAKLFSNLNKWFNENFSDKGVDLSDTTYNSNKEDYKNDSQSSRKATSAKRINQKLIRFFHFQQHKLNSDNTQRFRCLFSFDICFCFFWYSFLLHVSSTESMASLYFVPILFTFIFRIITNYSLARNNLYGIISYLLFVLFSFLSIDTYHWSFLYSPGVAIPSYFMVLLHYTTEPILNSQFYFDLINARYPISSIINSIANIWLFSFPIILVLVKLFLNELELLRFPRSIKEITSIFFIHPEKKTYVLLFMVLFASLIGYYHIKLPMKLLLCALMIYLSVFLYFKCENTKIKTYNILKICCLSICMMIVQLFRGDIKIVVWVAIPITIYFMLFMLFMKSNGIFSKIKLLLFSVFVSFILPSLCLGFNPFIAKDCSLSERCLSYGWSNRGVWAIKGENGWGLRDRYSVILPATNNYKGKDRLGAWNRYYDSIMITDGGSPFYIVGQNEKWGIFNILTHKYVFTPKYDDISRVNASASIFKLEEGDKCTYINTRKFIMGRGEVLVIGNSLDEVTKDSDFEDDFKIIGENH